jgi:glycosyltransferase involved in cell wall biosynthesis
MYSKIIDWPRISIVTPSYNQGKYIEETILSILDQNYPNLEYIVIDGGSTDNSVEIIKKYELQLTYWVSEPDKGQADAINKGLAICTGDIFNWINSDDLLAVNALNFIAEQYLKNNHLKVFAGGCGIIKDGIILSNVYNKQDLTFEGLIKEKSNFQQPSQWLNLTTIDCKINANLHYSFDWDLFLRLNLKEKEIFYTNTFLAYFRHHSESKTSLFELKFKEEKIQSVKEFRKTHLKKFFILYFYEIRLHAYVETVKRNQKGLGLFPLLLKHPDFLFSRFYISSLIKSLFKPPAY